MEWRPLPGYTFMVVGPYVVMFNLSLPPPITGILSKLTFYLLRIPPYIYNHRVLWNVLCAEGWFFLYTELAPKDNSTISVLYWEQRYKHTFCISGLQRRIMCAQDPPESDIHILLIYVSSSAHRKVSYCLLFFLPTKNLSPCTVTGHYWHHLKAHCKVLLYSRCSLNNIQCCVHFPNHSLITYSPLQQHTLD